MNCKPNSLAMIVRNVTRDPCFENFIGRPVKVLKLAAVDGVYGPLWDYDGAPLICPKCRGSLWLGLLDANLQQLPDLGEEEGVDTPRDVTLEPKRQVEHAR